MKKAFPSLVFCLLSSVFCLSQTPDWIWAKRGGGNVNDFSNSIATDPAGNVIVCGLFNSPTMTIGSTTLTNNGLYDMFVAKYDPLGNPLWALNAGGANDDYGNAVAVDAFGNIYVTGYFASNSITFGTNTYLNVSPGSSDIFIVKFDPAGNFSWANTHGGSDWDVGQSIATDSLSGSVYLAGYLASTSINFGSNTLATNGLADAFLARYDMFSGAPDWAINAGGTVNDLANGVDTDNSGNVFITGGFASSSITFGTNTLTNAGPGFPDIFTAKYDQLGNHIWSLRAGGPDNDHTVAVDIDPFNNVIVAGHYHSTSFTIGTNTLTNGGMGDPFIFKYTNSGNIIWARSAGGMTNDFAYTVITDSAGNAYLAGMYTSMSITFGSTTLMNASTLEDMFLTKYDSAGTEMWAKGGGGNFSDYINDVAIHKQSDKLFATGDFASATLTLGSTLLTNLDNSGNTSDHFIAKLDVITGGAEMLHSESLNIYPNPSKGRCQVSVPMGIGIRFQNGQIMIYNSLGEMIFAEHIKDSLPSFDISNQPDGMYFVEWSGPEERLFSKIVLQR